MPITLAVTGVRLYGGGKLLPTKEGKDSWKDGLTMTRYESALSRYYILWLNYNYIVKMSECKDYYKTIIHSNGFKSCNRCQVIILYDPNCYAVVRYKGENHNCPEDDDEGLGLDIINNIIWNTIIYRKRIYL